MGSIDIAKYSPNLGAYVRYIKLDEMDFGILPEETEECNQN